MQTEAGLKCTIAFQCAKVDTPVLSTKMLCQAEHGVTYTANGGYILDLRTGKTTGGVTQGSVYYTTLKIMQPSFDELSEFGRQGM